MSSIKNRSYIRHLRESLRLNQDDIPGFTLGQVNRYETKSKVIPVDYVSTLEKLWKEHQKKIAQYNIPDDLPTVDEPTEPSIIDQLTDHERRLKRIEERLFGD